MAKTTYASKVCKKVSVYRFYQEIKTNGPLKKEFESKLELSISGTELAKQRPNPKLDFDYLRGDEFGLTKNTFSLSAIHTVELGSKRQKRLDKALLDSQLQSKILKLSLYKQYVEKIKKYQRLGQLKVINEVLKEAISTFKKISNKLQTRKGLNPEERISLSTLKLATNEYKSKLNDSLNEYEVLKGEISFLLECSIGEVDYKPFDFSAMPKGNKDFPGGVIDLEKLKIKSAQANLEVEKSLGYSDLSIGPQIEYEQTGNDELYSAGFVLSFDLPLFHSNTGGKIVASKKLVAQKISSESKIKLLQIKVKKLRLKFNRSLDALSKMLDLKATERKHQEIERLFSRGIVSMALTIEAHRQNLDYITSRFETEMDLLDVIEEMILLTGDEKMIDKYLFNKRSKQ
jgi:hypothetical protein